MKKIYLLLLALGLYGYALAHSSLKGKVVNATTNEAISNVYIQLKELNKYTISDANGAFEFKALTSGTYTLDFSLLGYKPIGKTVEIQENQTTFTTALLEENGIELAEITINPRQELGLSTIGSIDFSLRAHNTTQDLLRLVPGLFIAQHAGGGKAEQIFLRGFDVDHGTDVALSVDGMPVNMVSHAHGQGYADLHFVIPETIDNLSFAKGPYDAKTGDFQTAGAVRFHTKNALRQNMVKLEGGSYETGRGVALINLLDNGNDSLRKHNAYIATEFFKTRGFFESPQNFDRKNFFAKYAGQVGRNTDLSVSLSAFTSKWDASGQIPERGVASGLITRLGSIDDTEGGNTARYNANIQLTQTLGDGALLKNQFFYSKYQFNLFSNFTFFLEDSVNGDQINQYESRNILGYNGSYTKNIQIGNLEGRTVFGIGLRDDEIDNIGLSHTRRRRLLINEIRRGDVDETNAFAYLEQSFFFAPRFTLTAGVRGDHFQFRYTSRLNDTLGKTVAKAIISPKINLFYNLSKSVQLYASAGSGFHSNDARVVTQTAGNTLPRALSADLGANFKLGKRLFVNAALWAMDLESEFVYVGDAGIVEPSGRSRRKGVDASVRYQLYKWLYADVDFNMTDPRMLDEPSGSDHIPLAPRLTSIGGLSTKRTSGLNGSIRYRYLGDRPAVEDNSLIAKGYFIFDAVINYTKNRYVLSLSAENIGNVAWKEAQFATETKLRGETEPVNEIHYTPGTPFFLKAGVSYLF